MENIVLVKIQTIINQRIHNNFCQKFLTQLNRDFWPSKLEGVIFLNKNLFFFARLNRFFYIFGYLNAKFQHVDS